MLGFLLDDFVATGDAGGEVVDITLAHFALALMIFLALQVLGEIIEEHLDEVKSTVILLLRGSSSGSMSILSTL